MERKRRSSRHDGVVLLLVLGALVVAAIGVYLLIAAAVVFCAWLVGVAVKKPACASATSIPPVEARATEPALQRLVAIDPSVFDDLGRTRQAAALVFDAWLQRVPKAPKSGADFIQGIEVRRRLIGRMNTSFIGRRFAWRTMGLIHSRRRFAYAAI